MTKLLSASFALGTALIVSACGSNNDASEAAQTVTQATATPTPDANNPFSSAEQQMNDKTMAAVGKDVGDTWVRMMIEHHQGAIDMSRIALQQNLKPDVAKMAQDTIDKQTKEVEHLREQIQRGAPSQQSADIYRPAMMQMQQAMMAASGADVSETFMRKMLAHHEGGVALSDVALRNGVEGHLKSHVKETKEGQQKDADMVRAMLRGAPMASDNKIPSAASSPSPGVGGPHDKMGNMSNMTHQ